MSVTFDRTSYGDTMREHNVDKRGDGDDASDRSEGEVFSERITSEGAIGLHSAFRAHIVECSHLSSDGSDSGKLSGEKQAARMTECAFGGAIVDVGE